MEKQPKKQNVLEAAIGKAAIEGFKGANLAGIGYTAGSLISVGLEHNERINRFRNQLHDNPTVSSIKDQVTSSDMTQKAMAIWNAGDAHLPDIIKNSPNAVLTLKLSVLTGTAFALAGAVKGMHEANENNQNIAVTREENTLLKAVITDAIRDGMTVELEIDPKEIAAIASR